MGELHRTLALMAQGVAVPEVIRVTEVSAVPLPVASQVQDRVAVEVEGLVILSVVEAVVVVVSVYLASVQTVQPVQG